MKEQVYLGIDTSCYTTSLFFMNTEGGKAAEARRILTVKQGGCGLMQSEMIYQHTRNLPELMEQAVKDGDFEIKGIAVSTRPRPLEESYMPAFLAGMGLARSLAAVLNVPLWSMSHQENHLAAAMWSAKGPQSDRFLFLHASGGTTDLLLAEWQVPGKEAAADLGDRPAEGFFRLRQAGGSMDLHAGQLVDRVGVAMGLSFPAGRALEQLAKEHKEIYPLPVSVKKTDVSLSGPCTAALRALEKGAVKADLAAGVQQMLGDTFAFMLRNAAAQYKVKDVIIAGGVSSNLAIRKIVEEKLAKRNIKLYTPAPEYSCDNSSGCAYYAYRMGEFHGFR